MLINEINFEVRKLEKWALKALKGITHLPSRLTMLSLVHENISNEDEEGVIQFICDELQSKDENG